MSLPLFQGAQIPARTSVYNNNTTNVRKSWAHCGTGLTATSPLETQVTTCAIARKPLGTRDLNAPVDRDPNSWLTGSVTPMNFTHLPRASVELLWFHAPSNIHRCWSADLLISQVLGCSPHLGQDENWYYGLFPVPKHQPIIRNWQTSESLVCHPKSSCENIRDSNQDPNLLRANRASHHSRAESASNNNVVFHSEPQLEPRSADHLQMYFRLQWTLSFCTYQSEKKAGKMLRVVTWIYSNTASVTDDNLHWDTSKTQTKLLIEVFKSLNNKGLGFFSSPLLFVPLCSSGSSDQKQECQNTRGAAHPARFPPSHQYGYSSGPERAFSEVSARCNSSLSNRSCELTAGLTWHVWGEFKSLLRYALKRDLCVHLVDICLSRWSTLIKHLLSTLQTCLLFWWPDYHLSTFQAHRDLGFGPQKLLRHCRLGRFTAGMISRFCCQLFSSVRKTLACV